MMSMISKREQIIIGTITKSNRSKLRKKRETNHTQTTLFILPEEICNGFVASGPARSKDDLFLCRIFISVSDKIISLWDTHYYY